jgi:site-specific recombinase XerD
MRRTSVSSVIDAFTDFLAKERNDSPHTVKAYARDLRAFAAFCDDYYGGGPWTWAGVDRLAIRGFLGAQQQRGLSKRSAARALSALRTFYRFLNATRGVEVNPARAARTPRLERALPAYFDRVELERIFAAAAARAEGAGGGFREAPAPPPPPPPPPRARRPPPARPATSRCWSCSTRPACGCRSWRACPKPISISYRIR